MTSPLNLDSKVSTPLGAALGVVSPVAFDFESVATASRGSVDTKRSFATVLGNAKKDVPSENRLPQPEKPLRAPAPKEQAPHQTLAPKPKFKDNPRAPAADHRSRPASDSSNQTQQVAREESSPNKDRDVEESDSELEKPDACATESLTPVVAPQVLPIKELAPVSLVIGVSSSELTSEPKASDLAVAETPSVSALAALASETIGSDLAKSTRASESQALSAKDQSQLDSGLELEVEATAKAAADKLGVLSAERVTPAKNAAITADALPLAKEMIGVDRVEKNAASNLSALTDGAKIAASGIFNNIENTGNNNFKKVDPVVGLSAAQSGPVMSSTRLDLSEASRTDVPASEAVSRVNLAQVVDEVAVISEKMRVSGQHRCVVDFDVAGQGRLRVEVVRRDDQFRTVFSTESESLRESLQAAFASSDRPGQMSSSFDWQGSSSDSSSLGQNGAQADADSRQNTTFKSESVSRTSGLTSVPVVSSEPIEAPVLSPNHRLQLFA